MFFWLCCLFGLALLLTQLRMQYFGSFALYLPWLVLADPGTHAASKHTKLIALRNCARVLLLYWCRFATS